jgi:hypothetical protein
MIEATDFLVARDDLHRRRLVRSALPALQAGEVLLRIDAFALTANTVTYAAFGGEMRYWAFFPAPEGWGRVPCWGFADVMESQAPGIDVGARYFGFYPIATHLAVRPAHARAGRFVDDAEHRRPLPPVYNAYVSLGPIGAEREALEMLYRPLFTTAWMLDDMLAEVGFHGAGRLVLSSASSKTAFSLAHLLRGRGVVEVIGLTSARNLGFVDGLGCYDTVLPYEDIARIPDDALAVYVDFSGAASLRRRLHERLRERLIADWVVGAADWSARAPYDKTLPGAPPAFFFAPTRIEERVAAWGREGYEQRLAAAKEAFFAAAGAWLFVRRERGEAAVDRYWMQSVEGTSPPEVGLVLGL